MLPFAITVKRPMFSFSKVRCVYVCVFVCFCLVCEFSICVDRDQAMGEGLIARVLVCESG